MTINNMLESLDKQNLFIQIFNSPSGCVRPQEPRWTCRVVGDGVVVTGLGETQEEAIRSAFKLVGTKLN